MQNTHSNVMEKNTMKTHTMKKQIRFFIGSPDNEIIIRPTLPFFEKVNFNKSLAISKNNFNSKKYLETIYEIHAECETN